MMIFLLSLQVKLDPRRFPNMSPEFAAAVGCLLQIHVTEPRLVAITATSDGWLLGRNEDDMGFNESLGTRAWLLENWEKLISVPEVGLTDDEYQAAREACGPPGKTGLNQAERWAASLLFPTLPAPDPYPYFFPVR